MLRIIFRIGLMRNKSFLRNLSGFVLMSGFPMRVRSIVVILTR